MLSDNWTNNTIILSKIKGKINPRLFSCVRVIVTKLLIWFAELIKQLFIASESSSYFIPYLPFEELNVSSFHLFLKEETKKSP